MIWGDKKIIRKIFRKRNIVNGNLAMVNPASVNLCLGYSFLIPKLEQGVSLGDKMDYEKHVCSSIEVFPLMPNEFCLATTMEKVIMPQNTAAFVQGRSSIGRIGLTVQNAGFVDPGFEGHITLELVNESPVTIYLKPGYPIAQLVYFDTSDVKDPYHGKYNGQIEATGSRMYQDKEKYGTDIII